VILELSDRDRRWVTAAAMLGMSLAALEATAVAAAVPTAIGELGGMSRYSWVFSAYLLTSTTTVPLYGKLADLLGRKRVFQASIFLFLVGSALSGAAETLPQLIAFRALQGLGAGGVVPVAGTLIGDLYTLEERAKMQGWFSSIWASASLLGPPLGGLVTDAMSWRWIFYLNIPFGLAAAVIVDRFLKERPPVARKRDLDVWGTVTLTASVTFLLLGLLEGGEVWGFRDPRTLGLFAGAAVALAAFLYQEAHAAEPMLPLSLFRHRLIAVSSVGNVLIGTLVFAITAFVPVFGQGVLGGTAMAAGAVLAPMLLGWPLSAYLSGRVLLKVGYRRLALAGGFGLTAGSLCLWLAGTAASGIGVRAATFLIGLGLGLLSMPCFLSVQNAVAWDQRGVATSSVQFFRTIGGSIAVAALGAVLNGYLDRVAAGGVDTNALLDPATRSHLAPKVLAEASAALASGLGTIFFILVVLSALAIGVGFAFPPGLPAREPAKGPLT
jgi:EmrB/QacA subfamily drug resistance transporter